MSERQFQIITFYEFKDMLPLGDLSGIRRALTELMNELGLRGTIIIASEGYNSTLGGSPEDVEKFLARANAILDTVIVYKSSFHEELPFQRIKVKIKPEIVTLRRGPVDISLGHGTHVKADEWNRIISDPETFVLDTRNDYEFRTGTFANAVNPNTEKFNDLPTFVTENLDPERHKRIAMFCTGGIRCEKFAPFMKSVGFENVFQLEGGILKYLEEVQPEESLWQGECFVFDERRTVDDRLKKGNLPDLSQPEAK